MSSSHSTVAYIYKHTYADGDVERQTIRKHLLLAKAKKKHASYGDDFNYSVKTGNPQGVSGDFATAQANATGSKGEQFRCDPVTKYGVIVIDGPSIGRAEGRGMAAMTDLVTNETDGVLEELGDNHGFDIYRANGQRGRRLSASTNVITLTNAVDVRNFKRGMTVIASANADGSSPRTGSTTVASVNRSAGTITLTSAAAISSFSNNDYLFREGDPGTCFDGLSVLNPLAAPGTIRTVDCSVDDIRLAGARLDDTASNLEENIGLLCVEMDMEGGRPDFAMVNPLDWWRMVRRFSAKIEYDDGGGKASFGFQYIAIATVCGVIPVYPDADCPEGEARVGSTKSLEIRHQRSQFIHIIRDDGRPSMRSVAADSIEIRARSEANLVITRPLDWGVCTFA